MDREEPAGSWRLVLQGVAVVVPPTHNCCLSVHYPLFQAGRRAVPFMQPPSYYSASRDPFRCDIFFLTGYKFPLSYHTDSEMVKWFSVCGKGYNFVFVLTISSSNYPQNI